jgi:uncharacterized protein YbaA (DUF1428 family)
MSDRYEAIQDVFSVDVELAEDIINEMDQGATDEAFREELFSWIASDTEMEQMYKDAFDHLAYWEIRHQCEAYVAKYPNDDDNCCCEEDCDQETNYEYEYTKKDSIDEIEKLEDAINEVMKEMENFEDTRFTVPYIHVPIEMVNTTWNEEVIFEPSIYADHVEAECECTETAADPRMAEWEKKYSV